MKAINKSGPHQLTLDELNQLTLEISHVLTRYGIDGYQYNEPLNLLRARLADALLIVDVISPKLSPQSWVDLVQPKPPKYRSLDDDWKPTYENLLERPEPGVDRRLEGVLP